MSSKILPTIPPATAPAAPTATATFTAAIAEAAAGTLLLRAGFINRQVTTVEIGAIESLNRFLGLFVGSHLDKAKTAGTAGKLVRDHASRLNRPVGGKEIL